MVKDSPTTAGELLKIVKSWGEKTIKKNSNNTYITTCCLRGFQEKLTSLIQKQAPAYSVIRHDWNFEWHLLLYKKMSFLAANTQDGFGEHGDKKYPMCTMSKNQAYTMAIPVL